MCSLMLSVFNTSDFSNRNNADFWARAIANIVNPICGGIDIFKNYLLSYTMNLYASYIYYMLDEEPQPITYSPVALQEAYIALMTFTDKLFEILAISQEKLSAFLFFFTNEIDWDDQTKATNRDKLQMLDTFGGVHYPEVRGSTVLLNRLAIMEAAFSCCYSFAGDELKCKEHLINLLEYYKMLRYEEKMEKDEYFYRGASFYDTRTRLPGAKTLLNWHNQVLKPELALWFIGEILRMMEDFNELCGYNNKALFEGYEAAAEFARDAGNYEKEAYYNARIADVTNIKFAFSEYDG
jgi:hypothetical protein